MADLACPSCHPVSALTTCEREGGLFAISRQGMKRFLKFTTEPRLLINGPTEPHSCVRADQQLHPVKHVTGCGLYMSESLEVLPYMAWCQRLCRPPCAAGSCFSLIHLADCSAHIKAHFRSRPGSS